MYSPLAFSAYDHATIIELLLCASVKLVECYCKDSTHIQSQVGFTNAFLKRYMCA